MSKFRLACASTADMTKEYFEKRDISCILFHFNMDGKQYDDDFGQSISYKDFYQKIADGAMPTTSQVNVDEHINFFEEIVKGGEDVLFLSFSSGLSGSYNSACIARDEINEKYPDRKVIVIDTLAASSGYGLLVDMVADLRDKDMDIEDAAKWVEENKLNIHHWFFSTDLTHFKRGGRVSATSAVIGTILGICPLLNVDFEGHLIARRKVRTKKNVIKEIVKEMELHAENGYDYNKKCFISHSACEEDALAVKELIKEKFKKLDGDVEIMSIGTVIGSHTGPGTVALFFYGDERKD